MIGGLEPLENGRGTRVSGLNQVYDPATDTWANRSPMPTTRNHAFSGEVNGKIYVIGGRLGAGNIPATTNIDTVEEYDPATNLWGVVKERMPTPRSGGGYATCNGKIYAGGGEWITRELYAASGRSRPTIRDEHVAGSAVTPGRSTRQRDGVHRQPAAHGERKDARRWTVGRAGPAPRHTMSSNSRRGGNTMTRLASFVCSQEIDRVDPQGLRGRAGRSVVRRSLRTLLLAKNPALRWAKAAPFPNRKRSSTA